MKLLCTFLCLVAGTLQACPTAADLPRGIALQESGDWDGTQVFTRQAENVVLQVSSYDDGSGFRNELVQGTFVLKTASIYDNAVDQSSTLETSYPGGLNGVPIPEPRQRWRAVTSVQAVDEVYEESQVVAWQSATQITIGKCTLNAIPGTVRYASKYGKVTEFLNYLPDFGFAILVGFQDGTNPKETYGFRDIAAVR